MALAETDEQNLQASSLTRHPHQSQRQPRNRDTAVQDATKNPRQPLSTMVTISTIQPLIGFLAGASYSDKVCNVLHRRGGSCTKDLAHGPTSEARKQLAARQTRCCGTALVMTLALSRSSKTLTLMRTSGELLSDMFSQDQTKHYCALFMQ